MTSKSFLFAWSFLSGTCLFRWYGFTVQVRIITWRSRDLEVLEAHDVEPFTAGKPKLLDGVDLTKKTLRRYQNLDSKTSS